MLSGGLEGWSGCSFKSLVFLAIRDDDDNEDDDDGDGDEEYRRCFPEDLRGGRVVL